MDKEILLVYDDMTGLSVRKDVLTVRSSSEVFESINLSKGRYIYEFCKYNGFVGNKRHEET